MTVTEALRRGTARLGAAGIDQPRREARRLLSMALGASPERPLAGDEIADWDALASLLDRRAACEPMALIRGSREFWGLQFAVSPATLIPRPDSETLVEAALTLCAEARRPYRVLDLGTGTGCLLLAVLSERPAAFGIGVDRSLDAVRLAAGNAQALGLADRAAFVCGDWAGAVGGKADLVLCNPPYVTAAEMAGLMPDVRLWEPASALCGGADGLDAYRAILPGLSAVLTPGGAAVMEVGQGQAEAVAELARRSRLDCSTRDDLAGVARAVVLTVEKTVWQNCAGRLTCQ